MNEFKLPDELRQEIKKIGLALQQIFPNVPREQFNEIVSEELINGMLAADDETADLDESADSLKARLYERLSDA